MSVIFRMEVVRFPSYKTVKKSPRSLISRSGCTALPQAPGWWGGGWLPPPQEPHPALGPSGLGVLAPQLQFLKKAPIDRNARTRNYYMCIVHDIKTTQTTSISLCLASVLPRI